MSLFSFKYGFFAAALATLMFSASASANTLVVAPEAHWLFHFGAAVILYAHIGGGALGIVSGIVASLSKKGSQIHRGAGKLFFWSMLVCYAIGGLVAPFLNTQQSTNFVAAVLALYLLLSGVSAARRRQFVAGMQEKLGLVVAVLVTLTGAVFMWLAAQSADGSVDGSPPQAYILFIAAGSFALVGEVKALYQKQLSANSRTVRHLWRMCMSFFIASGSAFFGQAQFFPDWFNASVLPLILGFFPFLIMAVYMGKYAIKAVMGRQSALSKSA